MSRVCREPRAALPVEEKKHFPKTPRVVFPLFPSVLTAGGPGRQGRGAAAVTPFCSWGSPGEHRAARPGPFPAVSAGAASPGPLGTGWAGSRHPLPRLGRLTSLNPRVPVCGLPPPPASPQGPSEAPCRWPSSRPAGRKLPEFRLPLGCILGSATARGWPASIRALAPLFGKAPNWPGCLWVSAARGRRENFPVGETRVRMPRTHSAPGLRWERWCSLFRLTQLPLSPKRDAPRETAAAAGDRRYGASWPVCASLRCRQGHWGELFASCLTGSVCF